MKFNLGVGRESDLLLGGKPTWVRMEVRLGVRVGVRFGLGGGFHFGLGELSFPFHPTAPGLLGTSSWVLWGKPAGYVLGDSLGTLGNPLSTFWGLPIPNRRTKGTTGSSIP